MTKKKKKTNSDAQYLHFYTPYIALFGPVSELSFLSRAWYHEDHSALELDIYIYILWDSVSMNDLPRVYGWKWNNEEVITMYLMTWIVIIANIGGPFLLT